MFSFHHVALSVRNLPISIKWYEALGFKPVHHWQAEDSSLRITQMKLGDAMLELFCFSDNAETPANELQLFDDLQWTGPRHFGLKAESIETARQTLIDSGMAPDDVAITEGKTGIRYLFLRDPDGNFVEILEDRRVL